MDEKGERSHLSFIDDGEMDIPLAHLPKYTESPKNVIDIWLEKIDKGILTPAHFKDHWRIWVPKFYALEPGFDWNLENDKTDCVLIDNLERFIANGDFTEVMKRLNNVSQPSSVCGRVFKVILKILIFFTYDFVDGFVIMTFFFIFSYMNHCIPAENVVWIQHVFCVSHVLKILLIDFIIIKWPLGMGVVVTVEMSKLGKTIHFVIFISLVHRLGYYQIFVFLCFCLFFSNINYIEFFKTL